MTTQLKVNGDIISNGDKWIYDFYEIDSTCPNDILEQLPKDSSDVEITINSGGGLVTSGNEIYTALKSYSGHVTVNIINAGSAASIIAMSGDKVRISPVGQIMIHNVSMGAVGDYHDMEKASEILQKANEALANAYRLKTGMSKAVLLEKMDKETWLNAEEAKEYGFADEIMFDDDYKLELVASSGMSITKTMKDKALEMKNAKQTFDIVDIEKIVEKIINQSKEPEADEQSSLDGFFF